MGENLIDNIEGCEPFKFISAKECGGCNFRFIGANGKIGCRLSSDGPAFNDCDMFNNPDECCEFRQLQYWKEKCIELDTKFTEVLRLAKENADANEECIEGLEKAVYNYRHALEEIQILSSKIPSDLEEFEGTDKEALEAIKNICEEIELNCEILKEQI